jgi:hypothetical protein
MHSAPPSGQRSAGASCCGSGCSPGSPGRGSSPPPGLAVVSALAALFMGLTACLASIHIDLERYEVARGHKAVHNPLKGPRQALGLARHRQQAGAPLLAATAAVIGGFAMLNQGLYETVGREWYGVEGQQRLGFVDFLANALIHLLCMVGTDGSSPSSSFIAIAPSVCSGCPHGARSHNQSCIPLVDKQSVARSGLLARGVPDRSRLWNRLLPTAGQGWVHRPRRINSVRGRCARSPRPSSFRIVPTPRFLVNRELPPLTNRSSENVSSASLLAVALGLGRDRLGRLAGGEGHRAGRGAAPPCAGPRSAV